MKLKDFVCIFAVRRHGVRKFALTHRKIETRLGFTLAEVLITLGIIGVVAAITIPQLIKNYKKFEIETRFKHNYTILSNAIQMAKAEYGDPAYWEGMEASTTKPSSLAVFDNYIAKYLKIAKKGKFSLSELGYKTPIYKQDGKTVRIQLSDVGTRYILNSGSIVVSFTIASKDDSEGNKVYYQFLYYVDLNGPKGPNTVGKDIFLYNWPLLTGKTLDIGLEAWSFNLDTRKFTFYEIDHQEMVDSCKDPNIGIGITCGALIAKNGWKIPKDYPLKFW